MNKMLTAFSVSLAFLCYGRLAHSQDVPQTCNVTFFNATTAEAPLFLEWSGRQAFPSGLASGRSMGPIMVGTDATSVEASVGTWLPAKGSVQLAAGQETAIIFYEGPPELASDGQGGVPQPSLRIFQTPLKPSLEAPKEFVWPALYLGSESSVEFEVNGEKITVPRGKTTVIARDARFLTVAKSGEQLLAVGVEKPTDCLIIIYGKSKNLQAGIAYR